MARGVVAVAVVVTVFELKAQSQGTVEAREANVALTRRAVLLTDAVPTAVVRTNRLVAVNPDVPGLAMADSIEAQTVLGPVAVIGTRALVAVHTHPPRCTMARPVEAHAVPSAILRARRQRAVRVSEAREADAVAITT